MQTDEPHQDAPADNSEPQAITTNEATAAPTTTESPAVLHKKDSSSKDSKEQSRSQQTIKPYHSASYTSYTPRPSGIKGSPGGGLSVTIDATGSWSQLARQDATLPTDASTVTDEKGGASGGSSGVFGLFGRKKGRGHSPKPKERGVLGKEGARQIIG
jgi:serine/threonine kinase 32